MTDDEQWAINLAMEAEPVLVAPPPRRRREEAIGSRPWPAGTQQTFRLYRFYGKLPREASWWLRLLDRLFGGMEWLLYIGYTGQYPHIARAFQHAVYKDWAPLVTRWEIDPKVYLTRAEAEFAESRAIERELPLKNIQGNGGNPRAIDRAVRRIPQHLRRARRRRTVMLGTWWSVTAAAWWVLGADTSSAQALVVPLFIATGVLLVGATAFRRVGS